LLHKRRLHRVSGNLIRYKTSIHNIVDTVFLVSFFVVKVSSTIIVVLVASICDHDIVSVEPRVVDGMSSVQETRQYQQPELVVEKSKIHIHITQMRLDKRRSCQCASIEMFDAMCTGKARNSSATVL
jgi:hypothetical protein